MDAFFDINPLIKEDNQTIVETLASQDNIHFFATQFIKNESDDEDEWEFEGITSNNIFDIITDDMVSTFLQNRFLGKEDV